MNPWPNLTLHIYKYKHNFKGVYLVTIQTDEYSASSACPMKIEERRLANVTHLADHSNGRLPRRVPVLRLLVGVQRQTLLLLSHHVTKLVADQAQDELGLRDVIVRRKFRSRHPQCDVILLFVVAWISLRIKIPYDGDVTGFGALQFSKCVKRTGDVALVVHLVERALEDDGQAGGRGGELAGVTH